MTLFALVKASPECTAHIGADPVRFFEFGEAPELETLPYVTHQFIAGTPYNQLDGPAIADHLSIQIDVWADSSTQCKAVANAIRSAIEGHCYVVSWLGTAKEKESGIFRCTFTIQLIQMR